MNGAQFEFDAAKSDSLRQTRGLGFEEVISVVEQGGVVQVYDHPDQKTYPNQRIFDVNISGYIWRVIHLEKAGIIRLITCYPSRSATKKHQQKE